MVKKSKTVEKLEEKYSVDAVKKLLADKNPSMNYWAFCVGVPDSDGYALFVRANNTPYFVSEPLANVPAASPVNFLMMGDLLEKYKKPDMIINLTPSYEDCGDLKEKCKEMGISYVELETDESVDIESLYTTGLINSI
jgi:hypothetical protein